MEKRALNLSRRKFTREFKLAAVRRLEMGASAAEVARACEVNANVLHRWRREFRDGVETAFPGLGRKRESEENRIAELEQKIGQQTMEIAFLKRVLQRTEEARKLQAMGVVERSTTKSSASKRKQPKAGRKP
jgi:transposase